VEAREEQREGNQTRENPREEKSIKRAIYNICKIETSISKTFDSTSNQMFSYKENTVINTQTHLVIELLRLNNQKNYLSINYDDTIEEVHQKVIAALYPESLVTDGSLKSYLFPKQPIHDIFAYDENVGNPLSLKKSNIPLLNIIQQNPNYFRCVSRVPRIQTIYRLFIIDKESYETFQRERYEESMLKKALDEARRLACKL